MLLCNLLSRENLYTDNDKDLSVSSADMASIKKLLVRIKYGDKIKICLKDVVEKLEICLLGNFSESEQ